MCVCFFIDSSHVDGCSFCHDPPSVVNRHLLLSHPPGTRRLPATHNPGRRTDSSSLALFFFFLSGMPIAHRQRCTASNPINPSIPLPSSPFRPSSFHPRTLLLFPCPLHLRLSSRLHSLQISPRADPSFRCPILFLRAYPVLCFPLPSQVLNSSFSRERR